MEERTKIELELENSVIRETYKLGNKELKSSLEKQLGKKFFSENLKDRIDSYEDVCKELNRPVLTVKDFKHLPEDQRERALATHQIENITTLFNKGWKPNFNDIREYKYYIWFRKQSSGWVVSGYCFASGISGFGSDLYYQTKEDALWCADKFLVIYNKLLN